MVLVIGIQIEKINPSFDVRFLASMNIIAAVDKHMLLCHQAGKTFDVTIIDAFIEL